MDEFIRPAAGLIRSARVSPRRGFGAAGLLVMLLLGTDEALAQESSNDAVEVPGSADGRWIEGPRLLGRWDHSAIYDPVRDRMLAFGGFHGYREGRERVSDVWALSLGTAAAWVEVNVAGARPSARSNQTAIYDPVRDRMVVFGGFDGGTLNDVWTLSLSGTPMWTELHPAGRPPNGSWFQSATYDPVRDRMVVHCDRDAWSLSLGENPTWSPISVGEFPQGASPMAMVYDPVRDRLVAIGADDEGGCVSHVDPGVLKAWTLPLAGSPQWTELVPKGAVPDKRASGYTAIYDQTNDRVVIFGGNCNASGEDRSDPWALSLGGLRTWTQLPSAGNPRSNHTAIYDAIRQRMIVFGGFRDEYDREMTEVWTLLLTESAQWTQLVLAPMGREGATAAYDPVRRQMLMSGIPYRGYPDPGHWGSGSPNSLMSLSLDGHMAWQEISSTGHSFWQVLIYDPPRDRFVGVEPMGVSALSLASGSPAWTSLTKVAHLGPAIYDPLRDRMIVVGEEVWAFPLSGIPTWTEIIPVGLGPSGGWARTAIYDPVGDRVVTVVEHDFGSDVWTISLAGTPTWSQLMPSGPVTCPIFGATAIYDAARDRMALYGGICNGGDYIGGPWVLSLRENPAWERLAPTGTQPQNTYSHCAIYDPDCDRMIVFGGAGESDDTWTLEWGGCNRPPDVSAAKASDAKLWPANHQFRPVSLVNVGDPDGDPVTITVTGITQDEPVSTRGDGATCPDARIVEGQASVRAERNAHGNGRVYAIHFTAEDGRGGRSDGTVTVCVPHDRGHPNCVDDGQRYTSTEACRGASQPNAETASLEVGPVGQSVAIRFELPAEGRVELAVFDVVGRRRATIQTGELTAGAHEVAWNLDGVPKGLYFVRMRTAASAVTQRVLVAQ